jgi:predicted alpha-1,2-mannosidase
MSWRSQFVLLMGLSLLSVIMPTVRAQSAAHIDPMLGVDGGGNVIIGPAVPYGMAKPGPDMAPGTSNSGWNANGDILGFSQTHVSGTGGAAKYGNILILPTTGALTPTRSASPRSGEHASAGYYSVGLSRYDIQAEITATRRTAMYRFTYPATQQANLLFDVGHILVSLHEGGQVVTSAHTEVLSSTEVAGSTSVIGGWNGQDTPYTVFFYAVSDTPAVSGGTWQEAQVSAAGKTESYIMPQPLSNPPAIGPLISNGAYLTFATHARQVVSVKIGISFVSIEQAKRNALSEVPGFDFDAVHQAAIAAWDKALAPIQVAGASDAELTKLSTALYHSLLMPVDRTGENPLWKSSIPYYDDFYTLWDTFRSSNPLLTLIDQPHEIAIVNSLIDIGEHDGYLPDGRSGNFTGVTQGGSDADMVLADAYVKHLPGIDYAKAYAAVVKDAEVEPPNYIFMGRGDLTEWRSLGYLSVEGSGPKRPDSPDALYFPGRADKAAIPNRPDRPGSRSMEYAANDYAAALMASGLGHADDAQKYLDRAGNWKKLWDSDAVDHTEGGDIHGFIWMRHRDGSWLTPFDSDLSGTWHQNNFYEGSTWTYSLYVPQDVRALIQTAGGADAFVHRLDLFFADVSAIRDNRFDTASGTPAPAFTPATSHASRYDVGNEPGFLTPYLYNWAGHQNRTAYQVRHILATSYHTGMRGLPGNDDSGAMGSFYVFNKLGFFPVAAQTTYLIGSPYFPRTSLRLPNGKTFEIIASDVSETNLYIAAATWNGKPFHRSWFTHDELMQGGTLVLKMTSQPTHWDTGPPPPSLSDSSAAGR